MHKRTINQKLRLGCGTRKRDKLANLTKYNRMYNDAAMQTQTHKHSHWDVVPVKEKNKRMQPNEIG
jgi:diadenosine tetraphosphate (Ap4A) HIT family hydrolase